MANTDRPMGFELLSAFMPQYIEFYPVATAYDTSVFSGDSVGAPAALTGYVCGKLDGSTRPGG